MSRNPQFDIYIGKAADFAQPILKHLRELVHKACPEVEEKIKWGFLHFDYMGQPMCHIAAFKQHAVMGFWKAALMKDKTLLENAKSEAAMGHLGRICSLKELPSNKKIIDWVKEAMGLNEKGLKVARKKPSTTKIEVPENFLTLLKKNKKAWTVFQKFPPGHVKEYVQWITEAKREETKESRMKLAVEWISEGKERNWKYK